MAEQEARRPRKAPDRMAGQSHVGDALADAVPEPVAQDRQPFGLRGHVARAHLDRLAETHDPRHVLGPGPAAALVLASVLNRHHLGALADVEARSALWTVDLVGGEREHVDAERLDVERQLAEGLDRVDVERDAVLARDAADRLDRLQGSDLTVRVHDADRQGVRANRAPHLVRVHHPELVDAHARQVEALRLQRPAGSQNRVVLDLRGDEMPLALRQGEALDREIVGLGAARSEDDLLTRDLQKPGDALSRQVEAFPRLTPESVDARRVSVHVREIRQHLREHFGVDGRRCVVVQIDSTAHRLALHFLRCYARFAMDLAKKKLGVLLSTGLEHPNLETAVGLSSAALDRGADLYLYLIDDGVTALDDPRVRALPERGAKLFVCAYGCQKRRIPLRDADTVTYCGLVVLTDLINATDRFIALN